MLTRLALSMLAAALAGACAVRTPAGRQAASPPGPAGPAQPGIAMPEVNLTLAARRPARPPLVRLHVDVTAKNRSGEPCWVLVSSRAGAAAKDGGIDKLERLSAGATTLGRFLGPAGFYAVALAPGAEIVIANLEIGWWNDPGNSTPPPVEVRAARDVSIGGLAIATWFEGRGAVSGAVAIDAAHARHTSSMAAPGGGPAGVELIGGRGVPIPILDRTHPGGRAAARGDIDRPFTAEGTARDAKAGAAVVSDGEPYYLEGIASWPPGLAGRRVRVSGTLRYRKLIPDPATSGGAHAAGATGTQLVIERPTWKAEGE